jgi:hypothetical protein
MDNFTSDRKMTDFLTILTQVELKWLQQHPRRSVNVADNKTIGLFSDITKAEVTAVHPAKQSLR